MTQEEREQLKAEIRAEILEEMSANSTKVAPGLKRVYEKWFYGSDKSDKTRNSKMSQAYGHGPHWKVWESTRSFVRQYFKVSSQAQLCKQNQDEVERVADTICQTLYDLKSKTEDAT